MFTNESKEMRIDMVSKHLKCINDQTADDDVTLT